MNERRKPQPRLSSGEARPGWRGPVGERQPIGMPRYSAASRSKPRSTATRKPSPAPVRNSSTRTPRSGPSAYSSSSTPATCASAPVRSAIAVRGQLRPKVRPWRLPHLLLRGPARRSITLATSPRRRRKLMRGAARAEGLGFYERLDPAPADRSRHAPEAAGRAARAPGRREARGRVLEVGIGSGLNLPFYRRDVESGDRDRPFGELLAMARRTPPGCISRSSCCQAAAEELPLDDGAIDSVVMTWTLCSVADPAGRSPRSAASCDRAAASLFVEHGRAPEPAPAALAGPADAALAPAGGRLPSQPPDRPADRAGRAASSPSSRPAIWSKARASRPSTTSAGRWPELARASASMAVRATVIVLPSIWTKDKPADRTSPAISAEAERHENARPDLRTDHGQRR